MRHFPYCQTGRCHQRLPLLFILSWGLLTVPLAVSPNEDNKPLLPDGSFEQVDEATGLPTGWTNYAPLNPETGVAYTLARARSGVASALLTDTSPTLSQGLRSKRVAITGGQQYEATVWVYITRCQASGFALYLEYWQGGQRLLDRSVTTKQTDEWVPLKLTARAPAAATEATVLCYSSSSTVGEACFDDASLKLVP